MLDDALSSSGIAGNMCGDRNLAAIFSLFCPDGTIGVVGQHPADFRCDVACAGPAAVAVTGDALPRTTVFAGAVGRVVRPFVLVAVAAVDTSRSDDAAHDLRAWAAVRSSVPVAMVGVAGADDAPPQAALSTFAGLVTSDTLVPLSLAAVADPADFPVTFVTASPVFPNFRDGTSATEAWPSFSRTISVTRDM